MNDSTVDWLVVFVLTFVGGLLYGAAGYFLLGLALWLGAKAVGVDPPFQDRTAAGRLRRAAARAVAARRRPGDRDRIRGRLVHDRRRRRHGERPDDRHGRRPRVRGVVARARRARPADDAPIALAWRRGRPAARRRPGGGVRRAPERAVAATSSRPSCRCRPRGGTPRAPPRRSRTCARPRGSAVRGRRLRTPTRRRGSPSRGRRSASRSAESCRRRGRGGRASTSTWPSVPAPAPMPIVGIESRRVISSATGAGTASSTIEKQPAASSARASSRSWAAFSAVRPCALKPPSIVADWGVRPIWPITGIPAPTIAATRVSVGPAPSSLTASAPPP